MQRLEGLAAIVGTIELDVQGIHGVAMLRVRENPREVKRALPNAPVGVHQRPGLAGVVGLKQPAVVGVHHGVDAFGIRARDADVDLTESAFRESEIARDFGPRVAAVRRFEEAARRAAARQRPRCPVDVPNGGEEHARIMRVHRQIDGAGAIVAEQDPLPGGAAVPGPENAPLVIGSEGMSQRGHVHHIGICRIDADPRDRLGIGQPQVLPTLAAIDGFVYAVALHDAAAQLGFAHSEVHDVGIRLRHGDRAHR